VGLFERKIYSTKDFTITYFPSSKASSNTLYGDDGKTNNSIQKNKYQLINFKYGGWNGKAVISIDASKESFKDKPNTRNLVLCISGLVKKPLSIHVNGKKIAGNVGINIPFTEWDEVHKSMRIHLILANSPLSIDIVA
jgi:hypothetical protein